MIRLGRIDHVGLRVADLDEAAARWCIQLGLIERARDEQRAYLACDDEPYCLELTAGDEPGHDHTAFELHATCSPDDARAHLDGVDVPFEEREGSIWLADPDGRAIQLLPYRPPEAEIDR